MQYLLPIYSNEFHFILQTSPDLRRKLEIGIRREHEKELNHLTNYFPLRIDFSNFKSRN
jgi:hypothetical protein